MRNCNRFSGIYRLSRAGLAASLLSLGAAQANQPQPNILLIIVDDMGMADLGSFGSEIPTPNLDKLATTGMRLTNFHVAPACSPSRAMLLTGVDHHLAGLGNMAEEMAPNQKGEPGYEGYLNDRVVTIASLLKDAGYNTYMTGKWHLGLQEGTTPDDRGFERSFAMLAGAAGHFSDMQPAYHPDPKAKAPYMEDGQMLSSLPANFEYSTQFFADQMIEYIEDGLDDEKPFFAYLSYTAPHWPLQAPDETIAKFEGAYDEGYDKLHADRLARQKKLGIIPADAHSNQRSPIGTPWVDLSEEQRRVESRSMEIYAAMIDEIDRYTGRLLKSLEDKGQLDDTMIIFMSDNGAEARTLDMAWPADTRPEIRKNINDRSDLTYENMGRQKSYVLYGPNWARAGAPAFQLFKGLPTEGGIRAPAFIHYKGMRQSEITDQYFHIKDIAPTILALAGAEHPEKTYNGREILPISGNSMIDFLNGDVDQSPAQIRVGEFLGRMYVQDGDWKMTIMSPPYGSDNWQLFNLKDDLAETRDLAAEHPEIVERLKSEWRKYKTQNRVVMPLWESVE